MRPSSSSHTSHYIYYAKHSLCCPIGQDHPSQLCEHDLINFFIESKPQSTILPWLAQWVPSLPCQESSTTVFRKPPKASCGYIHFMTNLIRNIACREGVNLKELSYSFDHGISSSHNKHLLRQLFSLASNVEICNRVICLEW